MTSIFKFGGRLSTIKQTVMTFLVASTVAITVSGAGSAQAATPGKDAVSNATPQATCPAGGQCFADVPSSNGFYDFVNRIFQQDLVSGYACGGPGEPCDDQNRPYYRPGASVTRQQMAKFIDNARRLPEIHIAVTGGSAPVYVRNDTGGAIAAYSTSGQALTAQSSSQVAIYAQTGQAAAISAFSTGNADGSYGVYGTGYVGIYGSGPHYGVQGDSSAGIGVKGTSVTGYGTYGESTNGKGVYGKSTDGIGVIGLSVSSDGVVGHTSTGNAVHGESLGTGRAGYFEGNVEVTGTCCAMALGTTKIDNPIDPANKTLNQALVASPDMLEIFRGHITLDANGAATIQLPEYFEALGADYDYQLTPVGASMPNLYVAQEVQGNTFKIAGGKPNTKVSWQVTSVRNDPYAAAHPIEVEQAKSASEQGTYLHPELYNQSGK